MPGHTHECQELEPHADALGSVLAASRAVEMYLELTAQVEHSFM